MAPTGRDDRGLGGLWFPRLLRDAGSAAVVDLARALIATSSEDPPGDTRAVAEVLRQHLLREGIAVDVLSADPARPNLVASIPFEGPGPNVVFNGHIDTLPIGDRSRWRHDPLGGAVQDGRIYGRGARCMKGGIAALTAAAVALGRHRSSLVGSVTLIFASDEVNGGLLGTQFVLETLPELVGSVALVGEGGNWINVAHKGVLFVELTARGTGGHGALSFARSSAIDLLLSALADVRRLEAGEVEAPQPIRRVIAAARAQVDEAHGPGTSAALSRIGVNIGSIAGGGRINVVAESARAEVDIRVPFGLGTSDVRQQLESLLAVHPGVSWRVLWAMEPNASDPGHPWPQLLRETSALVYGRSLDFVASHGFTDARCFRQLGIPVAGSSPRGAHVGEPDEYVEVGSLRQLAQFFALATASFLRRETVD